MEMLDAIAKVIIGLIILGIFIILATFLSQKWDAIVGFVICMISLVLCWAIGHSFFSLMGWK